MTTTPNTAAPTVDPLTEPFPSPFSEQTLGFRHIRTLVELRLIELSTAVREKRQWRWKLQDDVVRARWMREVRAAAWGMTPSPSPADLSYLWAELDWLSTHREEPTGIEPSVVDGVWQSDCLLPAPLLQRLQEEVHSLLEDAVEEEDRDWHPGSGQQVWDLVHPSLYCLVAGRSRVVKEDIPLHRALQLQGAGKAISSDDFADGALSISLAGLPSYEYMCEPQCIYSSPPEPLPPQRVVLKLCTSRGVVLCFLDADQSETVAAIKRRLCAGEGSGVYRMIPSTLSAGDQSLVINGYWHPSMFVSGRVVLRDERRLCDYGIFNRIVPCGTDRWDRHSATLEWRGRAPAEGGEEWERLTPQQQRRWKDIMTAVEVSIDRLIPPHGYPPPALRPVAERGWERWSTRPMYWSRYSAPWCWWMSASTPPWLPSSANSFASFPTTISAKARSCQRCICSFPPMLRPS